MKVGFLHSIIRKEEKLLLQEFRSRDGVELVKIDDRQQFFNLHRNSLPTLDLGNMSLNSI